MTTVAHKSLTGDQLHEPKGVDTASSGQVYIADGTGSGVWTSPSSNSFTVNLRIYTAVGDTTWNKPANLLGVEYTLVGGGGGASSNGSNNAGDTLFNGATAGGGERGTTSAGDGGVASGGDINIDGTGGVKGDVALTDVPAAYVLGTYGFASGAIDSTHYSGGSGAVCMGWFTAAELGSTETVTVGQAGNGTKNGTQGVAIIKEYIQA